MIFSNPPRYKIPVIMEARIELAISNYLYRLYPYVKKNLGQYEARV
jgi:hypothetical protein